MQSGNAANRSVGDNRVARVREPTFQGLEAGSRILA